SISRAASGPGSLAATRQSSTPRGRADRTAGCRAVWSGIGPGVERLAVVPHELAEGGVPAGGRAAPQQLHADRRNERQGVPSEAEPFRPQDDFCLAGDVPTGKHDLLDAVWVEQLVGIGESRRRRPPARSLPARSPGGCGEFGRDTSIAVVQAERVAGG